MFSVAYFAKKHLHVTAKELEGPGGPALIIAVYSIKKIHKLNTENNGV